MIKKNILLTIVLITMLSCTHSTQSAKNTNKYIMSSKTKLSAENFIATFKKNVQHFSHEPFYYLFVSNRACYYEILINDIPIYKHFQEGQLATPIDINSAINKSGKQTLTYKLYPVDDESTKLKELQPYTELNIQIFQRDVAGGRDSFSTEKLVMKHENLKKENQSTFIGDGQKYYEYTISFDAEVPYVNVGWSNSKDLRKMDRSLLLERTIAAYEQIWNVMNQHKKDQYLNFFYNKESEITQSTYSDVEDIKDTQTTYLRAFTIPDYTMQPLKNFKLVLYANGRIVGLESQSLDLRERGESALWAKYKSDEGTMAEFRKIYLHIPAGQELFEVIR